VLRRLVIYLLGSLRIEVKGRRIEQFLNLAVEAGLSLWAIERRPDRMLCTLSVADFFRLRTVVRACRCRVHILRRAGLPFAWRRLRRRPALMAGALACAAFLLWAGSHVWVVKVKITGPQNLDPRAVTAVAAEIGVRPGALKRQIDYHAVEEHLQKRLTEISRAVVRIQGTRVVVEVVEKAISEQPNPQACINLVARKPGVIEQVIPFQGEPQVKTGDVVKAGDLLVDCSLKIYGGGRPAVMPGAEKPPRDTVVRTVVAQAKVLARVVYQEYRELPLFKETRLPTGRTATRWVLNWKDQPIIGLGQGSAGFAAFTEERSVYPTLWRSWKSPVELVKVTTREVSVQKEPVSVEAAVAAAKADFEARLRWMLGPSDKVITPLQATVLDQTAEFAGVRLRVETLEDIALPREGQPLQPPAPPAPPGEP